MNKKELKQLINEVIQEMDLKSLLNTPKDEYDPSETKVNPFDDKDFAMKSKVLNMIATLIDRENKMFVKDGISDTQRIVDELVMNVGNYNIQAVKSAMTKLESLWDKIKNKYPSHNEKYINFKNELLTQLQ